jgi:hypothetical protein
LQWAANGPFGSTALSIDDALPWVTHDGIFCDMK